MTPDDARQLVIDGINYAGYRETDSALHDSDKNRLFGCDHYKSDRPVVKPSPWPEGDFEEKMATLLVWANALNRSNPAFADAQQLLERRGVCHWSGHSECEAAGNGDGFSLWMNPCPFAPKSYWHLSWPAFCAPHAGCAP